MIKITIYTKKYCSFCDNAKRLLTEKGAEFEDVRIDEHPEQRTLMIEKSGGRKTVPQIFIGEVHVGGCDELYELDREGKLDAMLSIDSKNVAEASNHHKILILGTGPAGYTAAIYAARANLSPMILAGPQKGGQLTTTTEVENFPGFPEGIDGNELMNKMEQQALRFEAKVDYGEATKVDLSQRPFHVYQNETLHTCDALIIATGATARYLGLKSEQRFRNKGVSACATCDGFFYRNQPVAVVGGGDTALEEANYLANICEKVYLIHRRREFRGSKAMQDRTINNEKIEIVWDSVVDEVIGDNTKGMSDLTVRNVKTGDKKNLGVTGLFVAIGHSPNTKLFRDILDMDENQYLTPKKGMTGMNIDGVFACGDVMDSAYRQAVTAAGTGCMAAIEAERWLTDHAE